MYGPQEIGDRTYSTADFYQNRLSDISSAMSTIQPVDLAIYEYLW
jgi:hypothetical protein